MKLLRRWILAHRVAHCQREVAHLLALKESLGPALDRALRELGNARSDLVFHDIGRPRLDHASGIGKRDGVVRAIVASEAELRG